MQRYCLESIILAVRQKPLVLGEKPATHISLFLWDSGDVIAAISVIQLITGLLLLYLQVDFVSSL